MKEQKRKLSAYKRKVHIKDQEWTYSISKKSGGLGLVKVCSPDRLKKWTLEVDVLGHNYCDCCGEFIDRGDGERPYKNEMTPSHVKRLIEKRILGKKVLRGKKKYEK